MLVPTQLFAYRIHVKGEGLTLKLLHSSGLDYLLWGPTRTLEVCTLEPHEDTSLGRTPLRVPQ